MTVFGILGVTMNQSTRSLESRRAAENTEEIQLFASNPVTTTNSMEENPATGEGIRLNCDEKDIPPKKVTIPKAELPRAYKKQNPELAGHKVRQEDGTFVEYDENGYVSVVYNSDMKPVLNISRYEGAILSFTKTIYDNQGRVVMHTAYDKSGRANFRQEWEYDDENNTLKGIDRDGDGNLSNFYICEIDDKNNPKGDYRRYDSEGRFMEGKIDGEYINTYPKIDVKS
ncbi:hypothetical protein J6S88_06015 [bacterium]|nr:hypothetical protein [bacterium]